MRGFYLCALYAVAVLWSILIASDLADQFREWQERRKPRRGGGRRGRA